MAAKKKRSPIVLVFVLLLVCAAAVILYLAINILASVELRSAETTPEAAISCQTKITKMLIDETLAFNYKNTKDIPFSELELNSWLYDRLGKDRVMVEFGKDDMTFSGIVHPLAGKKAPGRADNFLLGRLGDIRVAFRIVAKPQVRANRIVFKPERIVLGRLHVPPKLMPELPKTLNLNPFQKQVRTIKGIRVDKDSLLVTVYAD